MAEKDPLLRLRGVQKKFGGVQAVQGLDLDIKQDEIAGLIGPNGAGKSTLFNLISGLLPLNAGEIYFGSERIDQLEPYQIARRGIARTFQNMNNFPYLTVFENVQAGWIARGLDAGRVRDILARLGLLDLASKKVAEIPPVKRRLVEVGRALIAEPRLILFDEIMAGFNEEEAGQLIDVIREANQRGTTFLIIGHTMKTIMGLSHRVIVMHQGSLFAAGSPEEVQRNAGVQKIYLGK
jgi:branched-chain amino acid transport system ATP-binding protein